MTFTSADAFEAADCGEPILMNAGAIRRMLRELDGLKGSVDIACKLIDELGTENRRYREVLKAIVDFCDDPRGSELNETLAMGLSRLLPAARAAIAAATSSASFRAAARRNGFTLGLMGLVAEYDGKLTASFGYVMQKRRGEWKVSRRESLAKAIRAHARLIARAALGDRS